MANKAVNQSELEANRCQARENAPKPSYDTQLDLLLIG